MSGALLLRKSASAEGGPELPSSSTAPLLFVLWKQRQLGEAGGFLKAEGKVEILQGLAGGTFYEIINSGDEYDLPGFPRGENANEAMVRASYMLGARDDALFC